MIRRWILCRTSMLVLIAIAVCLVSAGVGAGAVEQWNKTFGGTNYDNAHSVQQTSDGGYILAGRTRSYGAGSTHTWLIKADTNGNQQWNKTFGGINPELARSVQQTSDGGYIIAGHTFQYIVNEDARLIKTDTNGNQQWDKTFGGTSGDYAHSVQQTSDGGYILAGTTYSYSAGWGDVWLIKTHTNGNQQWNKTFGGTNDEWAYSVQQTSEGGYILAGSTMSYGAGYVDAWLIKTDTNGNQQWSKTFGGTKDDYAYSVQQTSDGGYILAGSTGSYGAGFSDAWLIKTDTDGNLQWNKTFGGTNYDNAHSVQQTSDGGYIIAGSTMSYGAGIDAWLIKTDENGTQQWNKTFGGTNDDLVYSVQQTSDGSYVLAGGTRSYGVGNGDAWLIKVSGEANNTGTVHNINKSTNYTTIQAAIDDANPGDEIHVDSGTYYEDVIIDKQIILCGIDTGNGMPVVHASDIDFSCGIGIEATGVIIDGFEIVNSNFAGIVVYGDDNKILNNKITPTNLWGVVLVSNNSIIDNNIIVNAKENISIYVELDTGGILNFEGSFNYFGNNSISNGFFGISDGSYYMSPGQKPALGNLTIFNNTINSSVFGISLYGSNQSQIIQNRISNSRELISFDIPDGAGIILGANNCEVEKNEIIDNEGYGIYLLESNQNTFSKNEIYNNGIGIFSTVSMGNKVYHNNIFNNIINNSYDDGCTSGECINFWDNGYPSGGNYWGDYTGIDADNDGIGDTPYDIGGDAGAQDMYPLMQACNESGSELISIGSANAPANSTITISVSVANVTNISGISFDLLYNSSVVTVSSVSANESFIGSSITPNIDNVNGNTRVVLTNSNLISASAETPVIDIAFNVTGGSGSSTSLNLQNVEFSDVNSNPYTPAVVVDGQITVEIKGDFNGNGRVDIGDVAKVAFMVAGKVPEDLNADFNENGRVDIGDAAKIAFYLAGKVSEL